MQAVQADYFTAYQNVKLTRDANGVLIVHSTPTEGRAL
jgi:hypothetical protein